jgi:uncharacterized protein
MTRNEALTTLRAHRGEIAAMGVSSLSLFGSVARDEAKPGSDVDILVEFSEHARVGLFHLIAVKLYLEGLLRCPVDLGTPDALREPIREQALREAVRVA